MSAATKRTYNGWSNYETWAVNLWIENTEVLYRYTRARVKELRAEHSARSIMLPKTRKAIVSELAEELEQWADENAPFDALAGTLWADLLGAALQDVDWHEIATAMVGS